MNDCPLCENGIIVTVEYSLIGNPPERSGVPCWRCLTARAEKAEAERDALAAEVDRLRGVVDRCPADDTPLLHDDDNPQLKWWCSECGLITDRPSLIMEAPDA